MDDYFNKLAAGYAADVAAFNAAEKSKTPYQSLARKLGVGTPTTAEDINQRYASGVSAVSAAEQSGTITEAQGGDLELRLESQKIKALSDLENEREMMAKDAADVRQQNLIEQLDTRQITEDEFNARSIENYKLYVEEMNRTAAGKRAVQEAEMSMNAEYLGQASQLASVFLD